MYGRLLLLPASVVRSCLIYKLGKLTSPLSDFKRSFRRLPSRNSLNSELKPPLPMPLELQTALPPPPPPRLRNSTPRNPPSPSEFQDAARGTVWYGYFLESPIVAGIHCFLSEKKPGENINPHKEDNLYSYCSVGFGHSVITFKY